MGDHCVICYQSFNMNKRPAHFIKDCAHTFCKPCINFACRNRGSFSCIYKCQNSKPDGCKPADCPENVAVTNFNSNEVESYLCMGCYYPYDGNKRAPMLLKECGHTMCRHCAQKNTLRTNLGFVVKCLGCQTDNFGKTKKQATDKNFALVSFLERNYRPSDTEIANSVSPDDREVESDTFSVQLLENGEFDVSERSLRNNSKAQSMDFTLMRFVDPKKYGRFYGQSTICFSRKSPEYASIVGKIKADERLFMKVFKQLPSSQNSEVLFKVRERMQHMKMEHKLLRQKVNNELDKMESFIDDSISKINLATIDINAPERQKAFQTASELLSDSKDLKLSSLSEDSLAAESCYSNQVFTGLVESLAKGSQKSHIPKHPENTIDSRLSIQDALWKSLQALNKVGEEMDQHRAQLQQELDKVHQHQLMIDHAKRSLNFSYAQNPFYEGPGSLQSKSRNKAMKVPNSSLSNLS